jgi:superfamily I DNA and/or RNA helicase
LFERLIDLGLPTHMLTTQYRMHPTIREFPGARFYDGRLDDGCDRASRPPPAGFLWPDWDRPVAFVPVEGHEELDTEGSSKANRDQAATTFAVVADLLAAGDLHAEDIGVVTPYTAQVRLLTDLFSEGGGFDEGGRFAGLEVRSVDGYQGREKEVIVFCTVRSNPDGDIGVLADQRRLNVAVTRARRGLVVIGDATTLRRDGVWRSWLEWVEESGLMAWHVGRS